MQPDSPCTTSPSRSVTSALAASWHAKLGRRRADDGSLVRSMLRVPTQWSVVVGVGVVLFTVLAGLATRMRSSLFVPASPLGLTGIRQVFYAGYHTSRLGRIDVATNVVQLFVVSAVAMSVEDPSRWRAPCRR